MNTDRTLIVVPTYNERENVAALVAQLLEVAPGADVMLIDDDSPDGTAAYAEELFGANPRFSVLRRTCVRSYGRSLVDGYRHALERGYTRLALRRLLEGRVAAEGYAFLVEAVFRAQREGLSGAEVPITFTDRREGQSKMSRKVIFESVLMP